MLHKDTADIFTAIKEYSITQSSAEIIRLMKSGADLAATNSDNQTPMQLAASLGFWDCVKAISDNRKTDKKDAAKYTATLFNAIKMHPSSSKLNHIKVIKSLIKAGADLTAQNADNKTPIELATDLKFWDVVEAIASCNNSDKKDDARYGSALYDAVIAEQIATVEALLKANAHDHWGGKESRNGCLHQAVLKNNSIMIETLLRHGSDPYHKNRAGQTPLELACEKGQWESVEALTKNNKLSHNISNLIRKRDELFTSLMENAVTAGVIPITINKLTECHHAILKNDLNELEDRRKQLKAKSQLSSTASILSSQQGVLENIGIIITAINLFLNFPDNPISIAMSNKIYEMQQQGSTQADHIITFLNHINKINAYVDTLRSWLYQLQQNISQITWKVKNFFGKWVDGIPDHITKIQIELEKIKISNSFTDIIDIYIKIITTLATIPALERRHPETTQFYQAKCREFKSISFSNNLAFDQAQYSLMVNGLYSTISQSANIFQTQTAPDLLPIYQARVKDVCEFSALLQTSQDETNYFHPLHQDPTPISALSAKPLLYPDLSQYLSSTIERVPLLHQTGSQFTLPSFSESINSFTLTEQPHQTVEPSVSIEKFELLLPTQPVMFTQVNPDISADHINVFDYHPNELTQNPLPTDVINVIDEDKQFEKCFPKTPSGPFAQISQSNIFSGKSLLKSDGSQRVNDEIGQQRIREPAM